MSYTLINKFKEKFNSRFKDFVNFFYRSFFLLKIINRSREIQKEVSENKKINNFSIPKIDKKAIRYNLSIVIPTFCTKKKENYFEFNLSKLRDAINNSNLEDYEIVIFDNKSEIDVEKIVSKFKDLNIKLFKNKFSEILSAEKSWYNAANYTSGKYLYFLSDDDFVDKHFFIDLKNVFLKNYDFILARTRSIVNENYSLEQTPFGWSWFWPSKKNSCDFKVDEKIIFFPLASSSYIVKRNFFEEHGVTAPIKNGIDLDLAFRMARFLNKGYFSFNSVNFYRFHDDQGSRKVSEDPQDLDRMQWMYEKSNLLYKYFSEKDARLFAKLYILIYCQLLDCRGRFHEKINEGNDEIINQFGKIYLGNYWNKKYKKIYKKFIMHISSEDLIEIVLKRYEKKKLF